MSKHTPGPWDVFGAEDSSSGEWCELTVSQASMPFIRVCFMPSDGTETIMANARLIAAAPDLLALLKEWDEPGACGCDTATCRGTCLPARTRDAIANATGERS